MPRKMTPKLCDCGCGETTKGGDYLSGHDRKLGAAIERAAGGLLELKTLVEEALDCTIDPNADQKAKVNGHYRKDSDDYSIKVGNGSIYIVPQRKGLLITAHPNSEVAATQLFGKPTGRHSPKTLNYAKWEILK
ncbi:MAG: hypothetical protein V7746_20465 [Halioglobus sp.]